MSTLKDHDIPLRLIKIINLLLMAEPFYLIWLEYYAGQVSVPNVQQAGLIVGGMFTALYFMFGRVYDAFLISMARASEIVYSQFLAAALANGFMYAVFCLFSPELPSVLPLAACLAIQLAISAMWCTLAHKWYFSSFTPAGTMVIYDKREGLEKLVSQYGMNRKFDILRTVHAADCVQDLAVLDGVSTVFLSGVNSHERNIILKHCVENGIAAYVIPCVGDVLMSGAHKMHMFHLPMLRVSRYQPTPEHLVAKRLFDIAVSLMVLFFAAPFMLLTAIAIKVYDGGPVLYRQTRLTKDGQEFKVLKFRSMRTDAEKDGVARMCAGDRDPRITPVGRIIRACRMDEMPQLFNIILGDMSIVGPRPERPEIAGQYCEKMPEFSLRLQAKAGLTGYAQVYGKYNTTPYDKLQMDLMYIANPSIWEDIRICFATVKILFMRESTEGIAVGATTAMSA